MSIRECSTVARSNPCEGAVGFYRRNGTESQEMISQWKQTADCLPRDMCLHQLFEAQTRRSPDAVAVACQEDVLTYGELNARANQLAHHLQSLGVGPGVPVGICVERSVEMLWAILGILKAGGAYVPLDPKYPQERLAFIFEDSKAPVLVSQDKVLGHLPELARVLSSHPAPKVVRLDADGEVLARESTRNPECAATADSLAYVIYTSGSTGKPKGVAIEHHSSLAFVQWALDVFTAKELTGVLFATSICFDLSIFEMFVPLSCGGAVILVDNALALAHLPPTARVTLINTVPTTMKELLRLQVIPSSVCTINLAGEPLPVETIERLYQLPSVEKVYDLYGPTETTTYSTFTLTRPGGPKTIGRPIAGTQVYVLDGRLQPAPTGAAGEMFIGGEGVARGYLGRPELTAERFVPDPFSGKPGARLYKTGDLGRYLPEGDIEFLGRADFQVKIRGFRIELGEIEVVLAMHPNIRDAVVTARESNAGDKYLAAYVVARKAPCPPASELREFLLKHLPDFMVPSAFITLPALPHTPNGKVDRMALEKNQHTIARTGRVYVPPRSDIEEKVAAIWAEVLGVENIGMDDNFFELGGNSLLAVRMIRMILPFQKELGQTLPVSALLAAPTIAQLALLMTKGQSGVPLARLGGLHGAGSGSPMFFVPGLKGIGFLPAPLAQQIGPICPYYDGLQYAGVDAQQPPSQRVEDIAAHLISQIRRVCPHGPYGLCGFSFGGVVAYEMARQLQAQGLVVDRLMLWDSWTNAAVIVRRRSIPEAMSMLGEKFNTDGKRGGLRFAWQLIENKFKHFVGLYSKAQQKRDQTATAEAAERLGDPHNSVFDASLAAFKMYVPKPFAGDAVLLKSQAPLSGNLLYGSGNILYDRVLTECMGWDGLIQGGLEVIEMPGDHYSLWQEPAITLLAEKSGEWLNKKKSQNQ